MTWQASQPSGAPQAPPGRNPYADPAGLGVRTMGCDTFSGELLEVLRLTEDLGAGANLEPMVRERCATFASASLDGLAPVVRVERTFDGRLEVWSRLAEGFRLSAVLEWAEERGTPPSLDAALTIGDRLLAALASLQDVEQTEGASGHGAIAVDQIVVSEPGVLTLTDYAFGDVLSALQWPRERLWRRFRIAMPPAAGLVRFDHRVDVTQAAVVIASLLAGRAFKAEEYPRSIEALVAEAVRRSGADVDREQRGRVMAWLRAATELEPRAAFRSAALAREALRAALGSRLDNTAAVGHWLRATRGIAEIDQPAAPAVPAAEPVSVSDETPEPSAADVPSPSIQPPAEPEAPRPRRWLRWS